MAYEISSSVRRKAYCTISSTLKIWDTACWYDLDYFFKKKVTDMHEAYNQKR